MFWTWVQYSLLFLYCLLMAVVCLYGMHRYWLIYLYYGHQRRKPEQTASFLELPKITIQLPMFNEPLVAQRIIEAACRLKYPRDKMQIQVLDDSLDETQVIARKAVDKAKAEGYDIEFIHRENRRGYKAGALEEGLQSATGEFVAIFDADFIPEPDVILKAIHFFVDDKVGMVQTRWEHLNRDHSLLTASQAILLDGHFIIEHGARNTSGRFISFNGTAGIWRKATIRDAGGWHHDTLTEDLDLSYRAQMKGWRFVYLPELTSPAELPQDMLAYKAQQYRWTKGGAQVCKKMLGPVLRSSLPLKIKAEAFFHLTSPLVYIAVLGLTLLLYPCIALRFVLFENQPLWQMSVDLALFGLATLSASTFYMVSQQQIFNTFADKLKYLPFLMALGLGIAYNNAKAALDGLFGEAGEFVRTPKAGSGKANGTTRPTISKSAKQIRQAVIEILMGVYMTLCCVASMSDMKLGIGIPFILIFMTGYFYVGGLSLMELLGLIQPNEEPGEATLPATLESQPRSGSVD